jgi:hypothetical protein
VLDLDTAAGALHGEGQAGEGVDSPDVGRPNSLDVACHDRLRHPRCGLLDARKEQGHIRRCQWSLQHELHGGRPGGEWRRVRRRRRRALWSSHGPTSFCP